MNLSVSNGRAWLRTALTTLAAASLLGFAFASPAAADDPIGGGEGRVEKRAYTAPTGVNEYLVYLPRTGRRAAGFRCT